MQSKSNYKLFLYISMVLIGALFIILPSPTFAVLSDDERRALENNLLHARNRLMVAEANMNASVNTPYWAGWKNQVDAIRGEVSTIEYQLQIDDRERAEAERDEPDSTDTDSTREPEENTVPIGNPLEGSFGGSKAPSGIGEGGAVGYLQKRLGGLLQIMFGALAVLSLIPIVFGGIQLITSQGASDRIEKGKKSLFWGIVGLLLAFLAIVIINTLLRVILPA